MVTLDVLKSYEDSSSDKYHGEVTEPLINLPSRANLPLYHHLTIKFVVLNVPPRIQRYQVHQRYQAKDTKHTKKES